MPSVGLLTDCREEVQGYPLTPRGELTQCAFLIRRVRGLWNLFRKTVSAYRMSGCAHSAKKSSESSKLLPSLSSGPPVLRVLIIILTQMIKLSLTNHFEWA